MKFAWDGYVKYAWGQNELSPNSLQGHFVDIFGSYNTGATIVDSLDTLYLMDMKEELKMASDWVKDKLNFDQVYPKYYSTMHACDVVSCYIISMNDSLHVYN